MPQGPLPVNIALSPAFSRVPLKANGVGALQVAVQGGSKYPPTFAGVGFTAANAAPVQTSAGLAATYVGLCLSNPAGSERNLVVRRVSGLFVVAPADFTAIGVITGWAAGGITAHTTPVTPRNRRRVFPVAPAGLVDEACTLVGTGDGAPDWAYWLGASAVATEGASVSVDLEGSIVVQPGGYCALGTDIAGPAAGFLGSIEWDELSVNG